MSTEKLKRVVLRLRETGRRTYCLKEVRKAICFEIGTDERTISRNINMLKELGYLKRERQHTFYDTESVY